MATHGNLDAGLIRMIVYGSVLYISHFATVFMKNRRGNAPSWKSFLLGLLPYVDDDSGEDFIVAHLNHLMSSG